MPVTLAAVLPTVPAACLPTLTAEPVTLLMDEPTWSATPVAAFHWSCVKFTTALEAVPAVLLIQCSLVSTAQQASGLSIRSSGYCGYFGVIKDIHCEKPHVLPAC